MGTRLKLFLLWFSGYAVCFSLVVTFFLMGYSVFERFGSNLTTLTGVYAPYLTAIIGFWYAMRSDGKRVAGSKQAYQIAVAVSIFFNVVMVGLLCSVFFREGAGVIEATLQTMVEIGTLLAFLVGPMIGFFFGKSSKA